jgi:hypothetical protein
MSTEPTPTPTQTFLHDFTNFTQLVSLTHGRLTRACRIACRESLVAVSVTPRAQEFLRELHAACTRIEAIIPECIPGIRRQSMRARMARAGRNATRRARPSQRTERSEGSARP